MNIAVGSILATAIFLALLIIVLMKGKALAKTSEYKGQTLVKYGGMTLAMLYCCALFWFGCTYALAWMHGNRNPWLDIPTMERYTSQTPVEDKLPINLEGCTIIYYRYDCTSCHAIHDDLEAALQNENNVYYVCTRTEQGKKLRETYEVPEVPYGIYIPKTEEGTVTRVSLSKTNDESKTVLDKENLDILLKNAHGISTAPVPDETTNATNAE